MAIGGANYLTFRGASDGDQETTSSGGSSKTPTSTKVKSALNLNKPPGAGAVGSGGTNTAASYKKGGKVKHTGKAHLHEGERVLTRKQARRYEARKRV